MFMLSLGAPKFRSQPEGHQENQGCNISSHIIPPRRHTSALHSRSPNKKEAHFKKVRGCFLGGRSVRSFFGLRNRLATEELAMDTEDLGCSVTPRKNIHFLGSMSR